MRFAVLASGSGGNACYVESANARILVDAGLSGREIVKRLACIGVDAGSLDALVITHEHLDHIRGAGPLARSLRIPLFASFSTLSQGTKILGTIPVPVPVTTGQTIAVKDLEIQTFTKCHDAVDPIGLVLCWEKVRLGIVTDLGRTTPLVKDRLQGCNALIAEFNHDEKMLEDGPYPLELKRRIKGPDGHLSNLQAARLIRSVAHGGLGWVTLAHLSEVNNRPEKAYRAVEEALERCGSPCAKVLIAEQHCPGPMVEIE
jgi:phosphoribosyl 1,2-cyclic phosphodiesterase